MSIDSLEGFLEAIKPVIRTQRSISYASKCNGDLYCSNCVGVRKVVIEPIYSYGLVEFLTDTAPNLKKVKGLEAQDYSPSLFSTNCLQCSTKSTILLYNSSSGPEIAVFPGSKGGLATEHTPPDVAYYLDQAYRAKCVQANTAAIVMYRAALEQLLADQNYNQYKLDSKIKALVQDIDNGTGPEWLKKTEAQDLAILKDLGNNVIHLNSESTVALEAINSGLLEAVEMVFIELLDNFYELPEKREARRKTMQEARDKTKGMKLDSTGTGLES